MKSNMNFMRSKLILETEKKNSKLDSRYVYSYYFIELHYWYNKHCTYFYHYIYNMVHIIYNKKRKYYF